MRGGRLPCAGADGDSVELGVRPEDARIVGPAEANLTGRVAAVFFLGDRTRLIVEGIADNLVVVESSARHNYRKGDTLHLAVRRESLLKLT